MHVKDLEKDTGLEQNTKASAAQLSNRNGDVTRVDIA